MRFLAFDAPSHIGHAGSEGEAPRSLLAVTLVVALANILYGFFPQFPLALSSSAAELLLGRTL